MNVNPALATVSIVQVMQHALNWPNQTTVFFCPSLVKLCWQSVKALASTVPILIHQSASNVLMDFSLTVENAKNVVETVKLVTQTTKTPVFLVTQTLSYHQPTHVWDVIQNAWLASMLTIQPNAPVVGTDFTWKGRPVPKDAQRTVSPVPVW